MDHVEFLAVMKRILRPHTYIEIGVAQGATLFSDPVPEFVIGIDPNPQFGITLGDRIPNCRGMVIMRSTSDEAFAEFVSHKTLGDHKADMAFVDGMHHAEVVLRDIANCAQFSRENALIFVHDVFPGNEAQSSRQPAAGAWMGDVYKVVPILSRYLGWVPTLLIKDIPPSGMFILRTTGDIYGSIFNQYQTLVAEMEGYTFDRTMEEMNTKVVSRTSRAFGAFIEQSMGDLAPGEAAQSLIRSLVA